jgi:NADP-dependent 3-hydroxy acid dehydrogenase YdfG
MSKVYFITGASSGFGAALAHAVLRRGARAVLAARRTDTLAAIANAYGEHALPVPLNVTDGTSALRIRRSADLPQGDFETTRICART